MDTVMYGHITGVCRHIIFLYMRTYIIVLYMRTYIHTVMCLYTPERATLYTRGNLHWSSAKGMGGTDSSDGFKFRL